MGLVIWFHFGAIPGTRFLGRFGAPEAGYLGAVLFFVLSGFLITTLLVEERAAAGGVRIVAFYVRRAYRLLPALAVALVILVGVSIHLGVPRSETAYATIATFGYAYNIADWFHGGLGRAELGGFAWGHLWSLSMEEQFYLVWPLVLRTHMTLRHRSTAISMCAAGFAIGTWRTVLWLRGVSTLRLYLLPDVRADALVFGAALAFAWATPTMRSWIVRRCTGSFVAVGSLVGVLGLAWFGSRWDTVARPGWMYGPGFTVFALVATLLVASVAASSGSVVHRLLESRAAVVVGRRSYGLYLFHYPMRALFLGQRFAWEAAVLSTIMLTELCYRFVERPALRRVPARSQRDATTADRIIR